MSRKEQLLAMLAEQAGRTPIPVLSAMLLVAWLLAPAISMPLAASWLIATAGLFTWRWFVCRAALDEPADQRLRRLVWLTAAVGVAYTLTLLSFPGLPQSSRFIISVLFLGLATGSVSTNVGYRPLFCGLVAPLIVGMALAWALVPLPDQPGYFGLILAALIGAYGVVLHGSAKNVWGQFKSTFRLGEQYREVNLQLAEALKEADSASRAKTRFLAAASHDLRQPIHAITTFSAALSRRQVDARTREVMEAMDEAMQGLSVLLNSLLDISKLDAGVVESHAEDVALQPFLERLHSEYAPLAEQSGKDLQLEVQGNPWLHVDIALLERTLRNLLCNAIKYANCGPVHLRAMVIDGNCHVSVEDSGPGIAKHEQRRIFEEFYQINNPGRSSEQGLGLGLAIVKRLTTLLGGHLSLTSAPGSGSRFSLCLPTVAGASAVNDASPAIPLPQGLDILVVDDEVVVCKAMRALLEELGHQVRTADSTATALAQAMDRPPQLLLSDLRLRDDDNGIATVAALRRHTPQLPALLISGDIAPARLREVHEAGLALLHKPVSAATLQDAMAAAMHGAAA